MTRSSGILLHPTSLPGPYGVGDLGDAAFRFIDFLTASGQRVWQVLPLGPTGYGDSPYTGLSAFAGNPLLVSPERLADGGPLTKEDLQDPPVFPEDRVDYGAALAWKMRLLETAYARFEHDASQQDRTAFDAFCETHRSWLDDFALFMAFYETHDRRPWNTWPAGLARRKSEALAVWADRLSPRVRFYRYVQYVFFAQWMDVKRRAAENGIDIMGDVPIFVAHNSADVWAHADLFKLDDDGNPTVVAGVPPDYFSKTGQRWGNPVYRWDRLAAQQYAWWMARLRTALLLVDRVRLDHFRGFEAYWEIPAEDPTAVNGRWMPGPGHDFFQTVRHALGPVPIVAEDLGLITPEVEALRDAFGFPGMKVLQFAFGSGSANTNLPHHYPRNCVVYTGTHDNDTTAGWFHHSAKPEEREAALRYMGVGARDIHWSMIRLALASVAETAVIPLQDVLGLGSEARMNTPGRPAGNWIWRFRDGMITEEIVQRLFEWTDMYGRLPTPDDV